MTPLIPIARLKNHLQLQQGGLLKVCHEHSQRDHSTFGHKAAQAMQIPV